MPRKLSDREWEAWQEFLTQPLAAELFRALEGRSEGLRHRWAERLWAMRLPDPSEPTLQEIRVVSQTCLNLSRLGEAGDQSRAVLEELLHDAEHERDKPDGV